MRGKSAVDVSSVGLFSFVVDDVYETYLRSFLDFSVVFLGK